MIHYNVKPKSRNNQTSLYIHAYIGTPFQLDICNFPCLFNHLTLQLKLGPPGSSG